MKILKIDRKTNFFEVEPETLDDLWVLNLVLANGDLIGSKTTRRFRVDGSKESEKKTVYIKIKLEKKQLDLQNSILKITGIIVDGSPIEYVDLNQHHSIEISFDVRIKTEKQKLLDYEINLLENAKKNSLLPKVLMLVLDDESSLIARVNVRKFDVVAEIYSGKAGKRLNSMEYRNKYFKDIYNALQATNYDLIVVAGPGFEKEYFKEFLSSKQGFKKFQFTHINSTGMSGLNELLNGGNVKNTLEQFKIQHDYELIQELFKQIAKDGLANYGEKEVVAALLKNTVKEFFVTDTKFMSDYEKIRNIFIDLEKNKIKYHIITSDTDAGKQLDSLGGIACFLYYRDKDI